MTPSDRLITEWLDSKGTYIRAGNWAKIGGSPATLFAAMVGASNAQIVFQTQGQPFQDLSAPVDALYATNQDTLQLTLITTAMTYTQLVIPAPVASLFTAGGVNVDTASAAYLALAAAVPNLTDPSGNAVTAISAAAKSQRRVDWLG